MRRPPAASDRAFVLRVSPYGETDAVVQLFTERAGAIAAMARRARAPSTKRTLIIEPFHTLTIEVSPGSGELSTLRAATIATARAALLEDPARLEGAGVATRWTRALLPSRVAEPEIFAGLERLLDALSAGDDAEATLSWFGLLLLDTLGYGLELAGCARCARARPAGRAAYVSGAGGGVLCEACRRGVIVDAPLLSGATLDALCEEGGAAIDENALVLRVVREAIESRMRAVGAKT